MRGVRPATSLAIAQARTCSVSATAGSGSGPYFGLLREFVMGVTQGEGLRAYGSSSGKPARPYIWRLIRIILLTLPSMAAEL